MIASDKFGIPAQTFALILSYLQSIPEIRWVKVYGSRAMGSHRPSSDIDLAYSTVESKAITGRLLTELDELPTPYQFDVTHYDDLGHPDLKNHIDRVGVTIYSSSQDTSESQDDDIA